MVNKINWEKLERDILLICASIIGMMSVNELIDGILHSDFISVFGGLMGVFFIAIILGVINKK